MDGTPQAFFMSQDEPFEAGVKVTTAIVGDRLCVTVTPYVRTEKPRRQTLRDKVKRQRISEPND